VVGFACDMIAVFHCMLYLANTAKARTPDTSKVCCKCYTNEVLLGLGLFACFCLTWVGAICDADSDPQCMGNNTIHSTCAVLFFLLTDVICGVMACSRNAAASPRARVKFGGLFVGLALTTVVRGCRLACDLAGDHPHFQHGDNFVILAEVTEVALFIVFLNTVAAECLGGLNWAALADTANPGTGQAATPVVGARAVAALASGLVLFTVLSAYALALKQGTVPPLWQGLPELGALFTAKPANWIGRWGFVQAASALLWQSVFAQTAAAGGGPWALADKALFGLQAAAALALAGMGIVNEFEDASAHRACTNVFFVCSDVAALALAVLQAKRVAPNPSEGARAVDPAPAAAVAAVVCAASTLRFARVLGWSALTNAALEWLNLGALTAFWSLNLTQRPATASMGLAVLVDDPAGAGFLPHRVESKTPAERAEKSVAKAERGIGLL
jgi:hypothetical membrane protein